MDSKKTLSSILQECEMDSSVEESIEELAKWDVDALQRYILRRNELGLLACRECGKTEEHDESCTLYLLLVGKVMHGGRLAPKKDKCPGCDAPKEGPHRFSCCWNRQSMTIPCVLKDGRFHVDLPFKLSKEENE